MKNKVSIIVPIYNSEKTIKKCVDSLCGQTYLNIEILLIDDGSTDNSSNICDEYAKLDKRIKVFHKENGGVSSARNVGINKSSGDYITFVDSDDYIEKTMIEELLTTLKKTKCDITICNRFFEHENGKIILDFNSKNCIFEKKQYPQKSFYNYSISGFVSGRLYTRRIIFNSKKNTIKFNTEISIAEDDLFNYEVIFSSDIVNISYINNKLYHYVLRDDGAINQVFNIKKLSYFDSKKMEIEILEKNQINNDFLKADYIINQIRTDIIMNKLNIKRNKQYNSIINNSNIYRKEIKYSNLKIGLFIKYIIATKFTFIYKLKLKNNYN